MPRLRCVATVPELPLGGKARCTRCGWTVTTRTIDPLDRPLALTIAALISPGFGGRVYFPTGKGFMVLQVLPKASGTATR